jgi:hypothetical protein
MNDGLSYNSTTKERKREHPMGTVTNCSPAILKQGTPVLRIPTQQGTIGISIKGSSSRSYYDLPVQGLGYGQIYLPKENAIISGQLNPDNPTQVDWQRSQPPEGFTILTLRQMGQQIGDTSPETLQELRQGGYGEHNACILPK